MTIHFLNMHEKVHVNNNKQPQGNVSDNNTSVLMVIVIKNSNFTSIDSTAMFA